jgi:hypothetical protein
LAFFSYMSMKPLTTLPLPGGKMKEVMGNLDRDPVAKACRRFRSRIEVSVAANGDFFEKNAR